MSENWAAEIELWFRITKGGSLMLPDGWFGRPFDNIHRLTFVAARPLWLIIELDERLLLTLREPSTVLGSDEELVIAGFSACVLDRKEYEGDRGYAKLYSGGEIRFVAPPGG